MRHRLILLVALTIVLSCRFGRGAETKAAEPVAEDRPSDLSALT